MFIRYFWMTAALACAVGGALPSSTHALPPDTLNSVVSVLPVWPGKAQGGAPDAAGIAPEGSGIVLKPGIIATAWHVVEPAKKIDVQLSDGRILPARLIAGNAASDVALLGVESALPPFEIAPEPRLAQPVCAIGNAYGMGLSVTCGVISATNVSDAGFNPVEDFVQTDAAANPGSSGGALVDAEGRLVGMMSAIFASDSETNIGVNFAISTELLLRIAEALAADGEVNFPSPGWRLEPASREQLATLAAPVVAEVRGGGPASNAGIEPGDRILRIGSRRIRTPRDAVSALATIPDSSVALDVALQRGGISRVVALSFMAEPSAMESPRAQEDCPHPKPVCRVRQAVFPISSFDPIASATRIGLSLLVTNRHVLADRSDAVVYTPEGPIGAKVVPSAFPGDLILLEAEELPAEGFIPDIQGDAAGEGPFFAVGADVALEEVRVFDPGGLIAMPAEGASLGRIHVRSRMQPGVSGGALVDERGELAGISVGGGDGRFEAMPKSSVRSLLELRAHPDAASETNRLGRALGECESKMDKIQPRGAGEYELSDLARVCSSAMNHGQLLKAGRILALAGDFQGAIDMHRLAADQVPNSINARISLLVSLQLAGRFKEMITHAKRLMPLAPEDPKALRFAIQSGVWGDAPELAEEAYGMLKMTDPQQAMAARRFIDAAPPAPKRRQ